jgi:uncharacterized LabA/DUF88 family protein
MAPTPARRETTRLLGLAIQARIEELRLVNVLLTCGEAVWQSIHVAPTSNEWSNYYRAPSGALIFWEGAYVDRVAVFVDAGYLFAQGSTALAGMKLPRSGVCLDYEAVVKKFEAVAVALAGMPLLRIYWYDGTSVGPTQAHHALAHLPNVKVRLGFVNSYGEQKGVDSLIVTDMINLARNRAMADAVLLSGDEDLRVGVQQAQEFGIRVHLIGIKPSRGSQSLFLLQESDTTEEWGPEELREFMSVKEVDPQPASARSEPLRPIPEPQAAVAVVADRAQAPAVSPLKTVAAEVAVTVPEADLEALVSAIQSTRQTPSEYDRLLLGKSRDRLAAELNSSQKREVREAFLEACRGRLPS